MAFSAISNEIGLFYLFMMAIAINSSTAITVGRNNIIGAVQPVLSE